MGPGAGRSRQPGAAAAAGRARRASPAACHQASSGWRKKPCSTRMTSRVGMPSPSTGASKAPPGRRPLSIRVRSGRCRCAAAVAQSGQAVAGARPDEQRQQAGEQADRDGRGEQDILAQCRARAARPRRRPPAGRPAGGRGPWGGSGGARGPPGRGRRSAPRRPGPAASRCRVGDAVRSAGAQAAAVRQLGLARAVLQRGAQHPGPGQLGLELPAEALQQLQPFAFADQGGVEVRGCVPGRQAAGARAAPGLRRPPVGPGAGAARRLAGPAAKKEPPAVPARTAQARSWLVEEASVTGVRSRRRERPRLT